MSIESGKERRGEGRQIRERAERRWEANQGKSEEEKGGELGKGGEEMLSERRKERIQMNK